MCLICKKFKKGKISLDEAKVLFEEQMEFLSEEHIEEMEQMLVESEDTYDYIMEQKLSKIDNNYDDDYIIEEDLNEDEGWEDEDE